MKKILGMGNLEKSKIFYRGYFKEYKMLQSMKALDLAVKFHTGLRKGGSPEVSHQFEIVNLLLQLLRGHCELKEMDDVIAAGFLHDVVEDYSNRYSFDDLEKDFDEKICSIVKAVTKVTDYDKYSEADHEAYYEQILKIPEAVLVKCGDRIQNVQSIAGLKFERQKEYVEEVEKYFFPMIKKARRLYPNFLNLFSILDEILKMQIKFVKRIHELEATLRNFR